MIRNISENNKMEPLREKKPKEKIFLYNFILHFVVFAKQLLIM